MLLIQLSMLTLSFIYLTIIMIIFLLKEKIINYDTTIYKTMLITSIISFFIEGSLYLLSSFYNSNKLLSTIFLLDSKIFICTVLLWFFLMMQYTIYLYSHKTGKKTILTNNKIYYIYYFISLVTLILPVSFINTENAGYTDGPATKFGFLAIITCCIIMAIYLSKSKKYIKQKEFIPIIILLILMFISTFIQATNPQLLLFNHLISIVMIIMYNTIENPDMKLINELELAKSNAEKANLAKTEFLSSMSHEIRTPLNAIVGFSNAILEDKNIKEAQEEAKDIVMASQNLLEIVNGILDISKIEAGKMEIIETNYNLKEMCDNIIKLVTPRILEKPIELKSTYSKDLPAILYGDMGKVKEIITNILTNAAKYTDEGFIELSISCINHKEKTDLVISIEDTGRGIKPEKIDKLFTKFQRLEEDKNTTLEGTGLGLAITKSLVEMMGGKIIVQSKYGSGSKFTVYLSQKIISMKEENKKEETESEETMDYSNKKILVVDDNNLNIKVATRLLQTYKIVPDTCISGQECLEKTKNTDYDLILLDDMMPKMTGTETLNQLKKDNPDFKNPILVLTSNAISCMK